MTCLPPAAMISDAQIQDLLNRIGAALSSGDAEAIAATWAVPALVLADQGVISVSDQSAVASFFRQSIAAYRARGIVATRPEILRIDLLSEKLVAVDVRWPSLDPAGRETGSESSHYILQQEEDGELRIRVAMSRLL